jgi:hypothetical protein
LYDDQNQIVGQGGDFNNSDTILFCVGTIGIEELWNQSQSLSLYPNPAKSDIRVNIHPQLLTINPSYQVMNVSGQLVASGTIQQQDQSIAVNDFAPGMYIIRVHSAIGTMSRRFVVQP